MDSWFRWFLLRKAEERMTTGQKVFFALILTIGFFIFLGIKIWSSI